MDATTGQRGDIEAVTNAAMLIKQSEKVDMLWIPETSMEQCKNLSCISGLIWTRGWPEDNRIALNPEDQCDVASGYPENLKRWSLSTLIGRH